MLFEFSTSEPFEVMIYKAFSDSAYLENTFKIMSLLNCDLHSYLSCS